MHEHQFYTHSFIFAARMMKMQHFTLCHKFSSLFMLLMLAWLTVCLPCVAQSDQSSKTAIQITDHEIPGSEEGNPLTNTNEERSESGVSLLSEYLHHPFQLEPAFKYTAASYKAHAAGLYHAYHPKLIIPPPEA